MVIELNVTPGSDVRSTRWALTVLLLLLLFGCATPTPAPTPTLASTPASISVQLTGPWVLVFDDIIVEMETPAEVSFDETVMFHLGLINIGPATRTLFHGYELSEFIISKDGVQVMASHDQLEFGNTLFRNVLGPGRARTFETGFTAGSFVGLLVDADLRPLPAGDYEVYGIARLGLTAGDYEEFKTPTAPIRILPAT